MIKIIFRFPINPFIKALKVRIIHINDYKLSQKKIAPAGKA